MLYILLFELKRYTKKTGAIFSLLFFFVMAISLFPFGIGASEGILTVSAPGILWVCLLLSTLLTSTYFFTEDYEDGTLAQLILSGVMKEWIVLAKIIAHWCVTVVPVIVIAPLAAQLLHIPTDTLFGLIIGMLAASPAISALGALGASLTLGLKRQSALTSIVILPFYIPFIIFGISSIENNSAIFLLCGITLVVFWISLIASSAAMKAALEEI